MRAATEDDPLLGEFDSLPLEMKRNLISRLLYKNPASHVLETVCFHAVRLGEWSLLDKAEKDGILVADCCSKPSLLFKLLEQKQVNGVMEVLSRGWVELDAQDAGGNSALHWAAKYGFSEIIDYLVVAGWNPSLLNADGETASALCVSETDARALKASEGSRPMVAGGRPAAAVTMEEAPMSEAKSLVEENGSDVPGGGSGSGMLTQSTADGLPQSLTSEVSEAAWSTVPSTPVIDAWFPALKLLDPLSPPDQSAMQDGQRELLAQRLLRAVAKKKVREVSTLLLQRETPFPPEKGTAAAEEEGGKEGKEGIVHAQLPPVVAPNIMQEWKSPFCWIGALAWEQHRSALLAHECASLRRELKGVEARQQATHPTSLDQQTSRLQVLEQSLQTCRDELERVKSEWNDSLEQAIVLQDKLLEERKKRSEAQVQVAQLQARVTALGESPAKREAAVVRQLQIARDGRASAQWKLVNLQQKVWGLLACREGSERVVLETKLKQLLDRPSSPSPSYSTSRRE
jgi:hypothetical protein